MMNENKEISALFHLMDDPDEEVFRGVTDRIISIGKEIIPNLEHLSETSTDLMVQERVEALIHKLQFRDLVLDFTDWKNSSQNLLEAAMLVSKYGDPDLNVDSIYKELEKIRRNIWLELNNFLTSLERINVVSGILFNYYKFQGAEVSYDRPDEYLLSKSILTKKGNPISNGILFLILCELIDMKVNATNIPKHFILWYSYDYLAPISNPDETKGFYIDPVNGQIYSQRDVDHYLQKSGFDKENFRIQNLSNADIIALLLSEYAKCFTSPDQQYKNQDLLYLADLLRS